MHTHAIRTTEDKLAGTIDDWLGDSDVEQMPVVIHRGSRDYLVIVRHHEHSLLDHDKHHAHGRVDPVVTVGAYTGIDRLVVGDQTFAAWVEDPAATWILYLDRDHRPAAMWLKRDEGGGVEGDPVDLTGNLPRLRGLILDTMRQLYGASPAWDDELEADLPALLVRVVEDSRRWAREARTALDAIARLVGAAPQVAGDKPGDVLVNVRRAMETDDSVLPPYADTTLRELIADYLRKVHHATGPLDGLSASEAANMGQFDPDGIEWWHHPEIGGVRDFETVLLWVMAHEGSYGPSARGWRTVPVMVPSAPGATKGIDPSSTPPLDD